MPEEGHNEELDDNKIENVDQETDTNPEEGPNEALETRLRGWMKI